MTADRLPPFSPKARVVEDFDGFLDRMDELKGDLPQEAHCTSGHTLALTRKNMGWPAEEGTYLLGPTPVYVDTDCNTTFIPSLVLPIAEAVLKASVKSPETYEFVLPANVSPLN